MDSLISDVRGLVDQLNPLSRQNQILYFFWLFGYFFLMAGIWRCDRRAVRFSFLLIHQLFSVGVFISQVNIVVLAIYLWVESLFIIAAATGLAILLFRRRVPKQPLAEPVATLPAERLREEQIIEAQAERLTVEWRARQTADPGAPVSTKREDHGLHPVTRD